METRTINYNLTTKLSQKIEKINSMNSILTPEDIQVVRTPAIEATLPKMVFRNARPEWYGQPIGWTTQFHVDTYSHLGDARVKTSLDSLQVDTRLRTRTTYIPVFFIKDFFIARNDYEIAKQKNIDIVGKNVASAIRKCLIKEDTTLINGEAEDGTNKNFNGLYQLVGNTASGSSFGSYGGGIASAKAGIAAFTTDDIPGPYDLWLEPTQLMELQVSEHGTSGFPEQPRVNKLLAGDPIGKQRDESEVTNRIWGSKSLTAGTGLMIGSEPDAVEIRETVPLTEEIYEVKMSFGKGIYGRVYFGEVLAVEKDENLCSVTGI